MYSGIYLNCSFTLGRVKKNAIIIKGKAENSIPKVIVIVFAISKGISAGMLFNA